MVMTEVIPGVLDLLSRVAEGQDEVVQEVVEAPQLHDAAGLPPELLSADPHEREQEVEVREEVERETEVHHEPEQETEVRDVPLLISDSQWFRDETVGTQDDGLEVIRPTQIVQDPQYQNIADPALEIQAADCQETEEQSEVCQKFALPFIRDLSTLIARVRILKTKSVP